MAANSATPKLALGESYGAFQAMVGEVLLLPTELSRPHHPFLLESLGSADSPEVLPGPGPRSH